MAVHGADINPTPAPDAGRATGCRRALPCSGADDGVADGVLGGEHVVRQNLAATPVHLRDTSTSSSTAPGCTQ